jgi:hypothetical protein
MPSVRAGGGRPLNFVGAQRDGNLIFFHGCGVSGKDGARRAFLPILNLGGGYFIPNDYIQRDLIGSMVVEFGNYFHPDCMFLSLLYTSSCKARKNGQSLHGPCASFFTFYRFWFARLAIPFGRKIQVN